MTIEEIRKKVQSIKDMKNDPEAAHGAEDALYQGLLESIAAGQVQNPAEAAKEALYAQNIDFPRWCA
jgi:hypothetical protein